MNNVKTAVSGEVNAKNYLEKQGYIILETNYHCGKVELDIIAKHKDTIIFIEVKSRENVKFGMPIEAITASKRKNIVHAAKLYIAKNRLYNNEFRFDVVSIIGDEIEHIKDAFWIN